MKQNETSFIEVTAGNFKTAFSLSCILIRYKLVKIFSWNLQWREISKTENLWYTDSKEVCYSLYQEISYTKNLSPHT